MLDLLAKIGMSADKIPGLFENVGKNIVTSEVQKAVLGGGSGYQPSSYTPPASVESPAQSLARRREMMLQKLNMGGRY